MPDLPVPRLLPSCLSVPASDDRKLHRALSCATGEVIVDLEDGVAPSRKTEARQFLSSRDWTRTGIRVTVRVNAIGSPWCHLELQELSDPALGFTSVMVPKVESAGDLAFVDRLLDGAEAANGRLDPLRVTALIETAAGIMNLGEIVTASTRLTTLAIGYADLAVSLGRSTDGGPQMWQSAQDAVLLAARSAGLEAIDGPYLGVHVDDGFRASVKHAAAQGFDGKWVIHPGQLDEVNSVFAPSAERVLQAERLLDTLASAHRNGQGAVTLDGVMIDEALAAAARSVLVRAGRGIR